MPFLLYRKLLCNSYKVKKQATLVRGVSPAEEVNCLQQLPARTVYVLQSKTLSCNMVSREL